MTLTYTLAIKGYTPTRLGLPTGDRACVGVLGEGSLSAVASPGVGDSDEASIGIEEADEVTVTSQGTSDLVVLETVILNSVALVWDDKLQASAPVVGGIASVAVSVVGTVCAITLSGATEDVNLSITYRPISYADVFTADADAGDSTPTDDDALEIRYRDEGGMWSSWRRIELNDRSLFYTLRHLGIYRERQYEVRALTRTQMHLVYIEDDVEALRS